MALPLLQIVQAALLLLLRMNNCLHALKNFRRRGCYFINLDKPTEKPKLYNNYSSGYEISSVQFNPHVAQRFANTYVLDTSLQVCDVDYSSVTTMPAQVCTIKSKKVIDWTWSVHDANVLVTCNPDAIRIWDIRTPLQTVHSFATVTSCAQHVRWHPQNDFYLASSHEGEVRLWDTRKISHVSFITAHTATISSLEWYPKATDSELVTCCTDGWIKLWNTNNPKESKATIKCKGVSFVKTRYLPFGHGLVSIQKNDPQIRVWSLVDGTISQIGILTGQGSIKSFDFRKSYDNHIVSLSQETSSMVRGWTLTAAMQEDCGYEPPQQNATMANATSTNTTNTSTNTTTAPATPNKQHIVPSQDKNDSEVSYSQECTRAVQELDGRLAIAEVCPQTWQMN